MEDTISVTISTAIIAIRWVSHNTFKKRSGGHQRPLFVTPRGCALIARPRGRITALSFFNYILTKLGEEDTKLRLEQSVWY